LRPDLPVVVTIGDALEDVADQTTSVQDIVEMRIALQKMMATLTGRERRLIDYLGEGLTMPEIAEEEDVSLRTAERLMHNVRAKAQAFLKEEL
jgi:DNA-directed RNA polymerase specialized sigma24 family protein